MKSVRALFASLLAILLFATSHTAQHRAPSLGADLIWADYPYTLIEAWQDAERGAALAEALRAGGVRSVRFSSHGMYSHISEAASAKIKAENKMTNEYPWFPFADFSNYISRYEFTAVVGINVEEGAGIAEEVIKKFLADNPAKLVAVELSNEPWLNHRPWQPEDYAARAADVIERLTPTGVRFALPLTVGNGKNTPTKLSDTVWNTRMMRALAARVDLKTREDIYGVLHLYSGGVRAKSIEYFNRIVRPFAPRMRYLVTEFNIRLSLADNAHLTNRYAMEFARQLAELMNVPDIEALYVHGIPYHSILYWANGKRLATVVGQRDARLSGEALARGYHQTPAGKVYALYSKLAWNGDVLYYKEDGKQRYWAVRSPMSSPDSSSVNMPRGATIITLLNESDKPVEKRIKFANLDLRLRAPAHAIVCFDSSGREIEKLLLPN